MDNQPNADKWRTQADTAFEEANKIKSEPIDSTARKWGTDVSDEKIERDKHESEKVP
ncbi:MAG: hypothetical protein NT069_06970 [Planctomycetota bacterium]|nr:hypothetical protein [Planctomycetota bacterium]